VLGWVLCVVFCCFGDGGSGRHGDRERKLRVESRRES